MNKKMTILRTKLVPPRLKTTVLRRPQIVKQMKKIATVPLTLIHSGPGYGKSTLLSSFFRDEEIPYCWYTITKNDDDLIPFLHYLIHALRSRYASFGEDLLREIGNIEAIIKEESIEALCSAFINELSMLPEDMIFVIDDYHLVEKSLEIEKWMLWLIQHMPETFHLVLSSRRRPNWQILTSLKVQGNLLEITERDLSLSEEEIEVLFSDYYEFPLNKEEVERIYERTEGWVIAIQMIWQQLKGNDSLGKILENHVDSLDELFRYLAMEVFLQQSTQIQDFLVHTSILDELTVPLCNELLGRDDGEMMLGKISSMNLFLIYIGEGQYRYHALFKDFLTQQLKKQPEALRKLHQRAASYFQKYHREEQVIHHLQAIGEVEKTAEILNRYGREMIDHGKLESLLEMLKGIPDHLKDHYYMLWLYEGDIYRYRSMYEKALQFYRWGEKRAKEQNDASGVSSGLEGQARVYLDTIQPGKAAQFLQQAILAMEQVKEPNVEHQLKVYSLMSENSINLGRAQEAVKWYEKCQEITSNFRDIELEARIYLRTGRLQQVKRLLEQHTQNVGTGGGGTHLPRGHREINLLLSIVYAFMGEGEPAKRTAEIGIMQGIQSKSPFLEACGWMRMGHSVQLLSRYDFELARQCYQTALDIMEEIQIPRGKAEPLMGLSLLYGREKALGLAISYGRMALEETERVNDLWLSTLIRTGIGISYVHSRKWEEAVQVFSACLQDFEDCGDQYGTTIIHLWQAMVALERDQADLFTSHIKAFIHLLQGGGYSFLLHFRTLFGPRDLQSIVLLLVEAEKRGIGENSITYLLEELGLPKDSSPPGYTLRVKTLGEFRVWLGEEEVDEKSWHRGKAKELFQLFITKYHQLLPKEEILALLWSELDGEAANRDFKVALNALNKVLEPHRTARATPFFVQRYSSSYGLSGAIGLEIDVPYFEMLVRQGLEEQEIDQAERLLVKGLDLYDGDYLPERRYEDWCLEERERLKVLFLRGAERLAQLYVQKKAFDHAIPWCETILRQDSCWEEAYRLLIYCYYQKKNRSQAIRWYKRCCEKLEQELGIKPMPETEQMYEMVVTHL